MTISPEFITTIQCAEVSNFRSAFRNTECLFFFQFETSVTLLKEGGNNTSPDMKCSSLLKHHNLVQHNSWYRYRNIKLNLYPLCPFTVFCLKR